MKNKMNKCPHCGIGTLKFGVKEQTLTYKEQSFTIEQPGDWCEHCDEGLLNNRHVKTTQILIRKKQAEIDGLLSSEEIRKIRNTLNLTQKRAADICGGGPNAFSRYERGEAVPSRATSNLLRLLYKYPEAVNYLLTKD